MLAGLGHMKAAQAQEKKLLVDSEIVRELSALGAIPIALVR